MRNLLKSSRRKAQFFVLTAVAIVTVLVFISRLIEPFSVTDTSQVVLSDEVFLFNDIKEKAVAAVREGTTSCTDALLNLQEFKNFVENFMLERGYFLSFSFTPTFCTSPSSPITFNINQTQVSSNKFLQSLYTISWPT